jgi:hypothetical protein
LIKPKLSRHCPSAFLQKRLKNVHERGEWFERVSLVIALVRAVNLVSDTFFTLASKLRMRELLQSHTPAHLGQCDPLMRPWTSPSLWRVTLSPHERTSGERDGERGNVMETASSPQPSPPSDGGEGVDLLCVHARPRRMPEGKATDPEKFLESLPSADKIAFTS